ncbi:MAG TPA: flagellar motor switch protein FliM [Planctomycetota bacterium]|nr:flagellar motor switch protein FliM [Planctomycetota bacterium]
MPEVLSQNEVDALLSAVNDVNADLGQPEERTGTREVAVYDFKRPERVSKDQMRALETHHEVLARNLAATLSGHLRTIVDCKLTAVEQLTYSEFVMSLPNPTCFNVLTAEPLEGKLVLEINPAIVFPIIDKLLGGQAGPGSVPEREMTEIERKLFARITERILGHLRDTWMPIKALNFAVAQTESNPQLLPVVAPNEVVVLISLEVRMGDVTGLVNLCIPYPVIEPIMGAFSTVQSWYSQRRKSQEIQEAADYLRDSLKGAVLDVSGFVAETQVSVRELLELAPGQVLVTDKPVAAPLILTVGGKAKFAGRAGVFRGKKAFEIVRPLRPGEVV